MTILHKLISQINDAITMYKEEKDEANETISDDRQQDITELTNLLNNNDIYDHSAYRLRQMIIEYITDMQGSWLANISSIFDGSRLRQLINAVLEKKEFGENELLAQESIELRKRQAQIGTAQNGIDLLMRLDTLTKDLEEKTEQSFLAMKTCDNFSAANDSLTLLCQELISKNRLLQAEILELQTKLTEQLDSLKAKVKKQDILIQSLNKDNQQLRFERDQERSRANRLQKELDELKAKHTTSLALISRMRASPYGVDTRPFGMFNHPERTQPKKTTPVSIYSY